MAMETTAVGRIALNRGACCSTSPSRATFKHRQEESAVDADTEQLY